MKRARPADDFLITAVRRELVAVADPAKAAPMQSYMKSAMPYHGVTAPRLKAALRRVFAEVVFSDAPGWAQAVRGLWNGARFREERYAAVALTGHKGARIFQTVEALPLYEELIVDGAWWDYVDELAANRVGPLVAAFPAPMKRAMRAWSRSDHLWKRRTSIICQLRHGAATDLALLYDCIAPSLSEKEFFLRKAIGWALRQLAWDDPTEVIRYVREHRTELSGLSKREALKNVLRSGGIDAIP